MSCVAEKKASSPKGTAIGVPSTSLMNAMSPSIPTTNPVRLTAMSPAMFTAPPAAQIWRHTGRAFRPCCRGIAAQALSSSSGRNARHTIHDQASSRHCRVRRVRGWRVQLPLSEAGQRAALRQRRVFRSWIPASQRRTSRSCQTATNMKIGQMIRSRDRAPPRGMYRYLTSQRLKEACHPFQKPCRPGERSMIGGALTNSRQHILLRACKCRHVECQEVLHTPHFPPPTPMTSTSKLLAKNCGMFSGGSRPSTSAINLKHPSMGG